MIPYADYIKQLPRKPLGSGALIFSDAARTKVLVLKATYHEGWTIPGGTVDANESPIQACEREIKEELGLDIRIRRLLCVDYKRAKDAELKDDSIQFVFDGGVLSIEQQSSIQLNPEEHSEYRFVSIKEAEQLLFLLLAQRLPPAVQALQANTVAYLEGGQIVV